MVITIYWFNLIKADIMATESTEKYGNNSLRFLFFRVLPWIPWPLIKNMQEDSTRLNSDD